MMFKSALRRLLNGKKTTAACPAVNQVARQAAMIQSLEERTLFAAAAPAAAEFALIADPATPIGPVYVAPKHQAKAALATSVTLAAPKLSANFYDGINVTTSDDASKVIPKLRTLGVKGVRLWLPMLTWNYRSSKYAFEQAVKYKAAGFKVMMNVNSVNTASESAYRAFFSWLKTAPGFKSVDMMQIGNEPNHYKSWHGGIDGYMKLLKVAWSVLHPTGMKILGAGVTYDVQACKELKAKGYLNYVDYAAFHPYGNSPAQVIERLRQARAVYDSKPLILSEWNVRGQASGTQWANALKTIRKDIAKYCDAAFYFCLVKSNTMAGEAGAYTKSYQPNGAYFSAVNAFQYMEGGSKR
jgi:hypothetical protein